MMADLKVGDTVRIKKDGAKAVVTNDFAVPDRKQQRVEYRREDNGSVYECWVDEVVRVGGGAAPAPVAVEEEPEAPAEEPVRLVRVDDAKPKGRARKAN
jgi:hypothetical protein